MSDAEMTLGEMRLTEATHQKQNRRNTIRQRMAKEERILERFDRDGNRWRKVYFGGGAHFRNWLDQFLEVHGKDNIEVEEMDSRGFKCFEESGEKMYRIWVKDSNRHQTDKLS